MYRGRRSSLEQSLIVDASKRREQRREDGEEPTDERIGRLAFPEAVLAARQLRARRAARERHQRQVLHCGEPSLEEDAEEQPSEDRLHLREQLERGRVDRLEDEKDAVVVDKVDGRGKHVREELGERILVEHGAHLPTQDGGPEQHARDYELEPLAQHRGRRHRVVKAAVRVLRRGHEDRLQRHEQRCCAGVARNTPIKHARRGLQHFCHSRAACGPTRREVVVRQGDCPAASLVTCE